MKNRDDFDFAYEYRFGLDWQWMGWHRLLTFWLEIGILEFKLNVCLFGVAFGLGWHIVWPKITTCTTTDCISDEVKDVV